MVPASDSPQSCHSNVVTVVGMKAVQLHSLTWKLSSNMLRMMALKYSCVLIDVEQIGYGTMSCIDGLDIN